ncbi:MAG: hypothetical protein ACOX83_08035 [Candidatus Spyradocola sp.]|jgi:hypothetical protein
MLKQVGACLVALALGALGFWWIAREHKRLDALEDALRAVRLLRAQVEHLRLPIREAVESLHGQCRLADVLFDAGCPLEGESLSTALRTAGLSGEAARILKALFAAVPMLSAGDTGPFDSALEQLRELRDLKRAALDQSAALYPRLGLLAAFAALILLL